MLLIQRKVKELFPGQEGYIGMKAIGSEDVKDMLKDSANAVSFNKIQYLIRFIKRAYDVNQVQVTTYALAFHINNWVIKYRL